MTDIVVIWGREGEPKQQTVLTDSALRIGRSHHCAIQLRGWGIAKEHAVILQIDRQQYIRDLGGLGGVRVNGERIRDFGPLSPSDRVQIGSYLLQISGPSNPKALDVGVSAADAQGNSGAGQENTSSELVFPSAYRESFTEPSIKVDFDHAGERPLDEAGVIQIKNDEARSAQVLALSDDADTPAFRLAIASSSMAASADAMASSIRAADDALLGGPKEGQASGEQASIEEAHDCQQQAQYELSANFAEHVSWLRAAAFAELDRQGSRVGDGRKARLEDELALICLRLLSSEHGRNQALVELADPEKRALIKATVDECLGLGPIQRLMNDPSISEIMVNGPSAIYIERDGCLHRARLHFSSEQSLRHVAERIAARAGRRLDLAMPSRDARLPDGSRVNIVLPPLAIRGTHITIRKFSRNLRSLSDLVQSGAASPMLARFLRWAVINRLNILVAGGTGSGKTTLLNVLAREINPDHRVITIEDAAELQFDHPHCVSLETRMAGHEGAGSVSIRDLLRNALRMRPDRIMIGECRGGEALDLLQALNTGHGGSMSTIHANSPRDALGRLEVLTMLAGLDLPVDAIRSQIASAFHIVIQTNRLSDGSRRISSVCEVSGLEAGRYRMQTLFSLNSDKVFDSPVYQTCVSTPTCLEAIIGPLHSPWIELFQTESSTSEHQLRRATNPPQDAVSRVKQAHTMPTNPRLAA